MLENFKKRVIIFDFDGVIAETFSFCYNIWSLLIPLTLNEYRKWFENNINDTLQKIEKEKKDKFFDEYSIKLKDSKVNDVIVETIKKLSENYILAIISSTITPLISDYLKSSEIRNCFNEILGNDIGENKVRKIQMVLDKYSINPFEAIFITDTLGDIKEAEKCGVKSIAVTWGYHTAEILKRGNPYKIINLRDEIVPSINEYFGSLK